MPLRYTNQRHNPFQPREHVTHSLLTRNHQKQAHTSALSTRIRISPSPHSPTPAIEGMGNCCGSESGNFKGEGRTLNAAPASAPAQSGNQSAAVPPKISGSQGQGRTLGKAPDQSTSAGEAAARAAEVRRRSFSPSSLKSMKRGHGRGSRMVSTMWL